MAVTDQYIGEIRIFGGSNPPSGWAVCNGQAVSRTTYSDLFNLIGTTYGVGDGSTTFALPDLRGRVAMGAGQGPGLSNRTLGEMGGAETVTLALNQIPSHSHVPQASSAGTTTNPAGNVWAKSAAVQFAPSNSPLSTMNAGAMTSTGSDGAHENMLPFQALNFMIALTGTVPLND